jgi:hypothetical protein
MSVIARSKSVVVFPMGRLDGVQVLQGVVYWLKRLERLAPVDK